ncbi:hypothetical protein [Nitrococcus mobilis]|uniref:Uncharacterized protein n=1 Tax=Nitrococcus mobilis Nb-231 TaxID=314278 RepID=A4BSM4_9GAMM|nr:hypothetical protein [Nitrococcus mobilis]EAR21294.1 hypothetical protein NB231_08555 [Nitrococcus mobilis Nb-231]
MATVNFSVPESVKQAFNEAFAGENKSAILTRLMEQAIEERRRQQRRASVVAQLLEARREQAPLSDEAIAKARRQGRP